jgi:hypothetical protein
VNLMMLHQAAQGWNVRRWTAATGGSERVIVNAGERRKAGRNICHDSFGSFSATTRAIADIARPVRDWFVAVAKSGPVIAWERAFVTLTGSGGLPGISLVQQKLHRIVNGIVKKAKSVLCLQKNINIEVMI